MADLDLSIIIVNYNVKHFLEQCLLSALHALNGIAGEIIVIDNNSQDGSQAMLHERFGDQIMLIENRDNPGFSKANNQGIRLSRGRHVLLLNPDTVVEEETFRRCLDFMEARSDVGALGVKMIDGAGVFLPESKRALPTPWVSFYKIFGLSALFPRSRRFGRYHLTYLDKEETHEIEILSGAFMWLRKSVLDEIGLLDETFFMYGEDIDLSYRVILAGYKNYYFSDTQIIHYKGESTKKGSLNYVRVFYQAMIIFARKHFGGSKQHLFIAAIRLAVYVRASLAVLYRLGKRFGFPLIETLLFYLSALGITAYWEYYIKYLEFSEYPAVFRYGYLPTYALLFTGLLGGLGAYKRPFQLRPLILAPLLGFVSIATVTYMVSFIDNYSRAIVGLMSVFAMLIAIATRGLLNYRRGGTFIFTEERTRRVLMVGESQEVQRVTRLLRSEIHYSADVMGRVTLQAEAGGEGEELPCLGHLGQLEAVVRTFDVDEVIFCHAGMSTRKIFQQMTRHQARPVSYKIAPPGVDFVIGPQETLTPRRQQRRPDRLNDPVQRRMKRIVDLSGSIILLVSFPFLFWRYQRPGAALQRLLMALIGKEHLVGYVPSDVEDLPPLLPASLSLQHRIREDLPRLDAKGMNQYYAQRYRWTLDVEIIWKAWRKI